jgi:hypothetical protein
LYLTSVDAARETGARKWAYGARKAGGTNVWQDKTSGGSKRPAGKMSGRTKIQRHNAVGQNVCRDKTSVRVIFLRSMLDTIFTKKNLLLINLLSVREKTSNPYTLSIGGRGNPRNVHTSAHRQPQQIWASLCCLRPNSFLARRGPISYRT